MRVNDYKISFRESGFSNFQHILTYMFVRVQQYMRQMMSILDKILHTYKGHMGLVEHYLFIFFHELFLLLG